MDTLLALTVGTLNIVCFFIGVKAGRHEEVKAPNMARINPVNLYNEYQEKREVQKEKEKVETILRNLDNYDGTPFGQEDVG
jgi:hypothetical protein